MLWFLIKEIYAWFKGTNCCAVCKRYINPRNGEIYGDDVGHLFHSLCYTREVLITCPTCEFAIQEAGAVYMDRFGRSHHLACVQKLQAEVEDAE